MSAPSDIRAAWLTNVFEDGDVLNMTEKIYDYDLTNDSRTERTKFMYGTIVSFITYLVLRRPVQRVIGGNSPGGEKVQFEYQVDVNRYLEADVAGANYNQVIDDLVTIESKVISELGKRWDDTIDFYNLTDVFAPVQIELDGRAVWQGRNVYTAVLRTDYV